MKRLIALLIVLAMLGTLILTGCGKETETEGTTTASSEVTTEKSSEPVATPAEVITCKWVIPGDTPAELEKGLEIVNNKLVADGVNVKIQKQCIPWDAWDQRVNIMLSSNEEFDLLNVMNDRTSVSQYVSRGALADITEYIDKYGENIKKVNPDIMFRAATISDKIYAIPAFWVEFSHQPEISLRLDILKEYNLPVPKTFDELTTTFETIMKNWKGDQKPYAGGIIGSKSFGFGVNRKSYDEWPFAVLDSFFYVNETTGEVKNYFETEMFKKDCANARSWYEKGLINPDVLVFTDEQLKAQLQSGNWVVHFGTYGDSIDNIKVNYPNITVDDFEFLQLNPEKPNLRPYGTRNMNAIPVASKHPEAGVKFFNWLYANQENYDMFMYGREGVDYKKVGDRAREDIVNLAQGRPLYYADDWMCGNLKFFRISGNSPRKTELIKYTIDETAINSIAGDFIFDATSIKTELADCKTELSASISPIANGVLEYDKAFPAALEKLKKAGIDKVVEVYKTQFDAYLKTKKK